MDLGNPTVQIELISHLYMKPKEVVSKSMHIKWDVPKKFVHRFRDRLSVFFSTIKV